jgi:hypothetical protein
MLVLLQGLLPLQQQLGQPLDVQVRLLAALPAVQAA